MASMLAGNEKVTNAGAKASRRARPDTKTAVIYAVLDAFGTAIYIGQSVQLHHRLCGHRRSSWWPEAAFVTWVPVRYGPRGRHLNDHETEAISSVAPRYNRNRHWDGIGVARAAERRRIYLAYVDRHPASSGLQREARFHRWLDAVAAGVAHQSETLNLLAVGPGPVGEWMLP
ncbi:MAG: hypothetical protein HY828_18340 [Actinobacteria bacterium]|nr:hypothetical protein [Actinomycetota bacterium]